MANLPEPYNESFLPLIQKFYSLEAIAREPWDPSTILFVPLKKQILLENGGAETFATVIYLSILNLNFEIKRVKNVNEISPSGRGPLLKCGKYSIGEYESIVNFSNLKGYRLLANFLDSSKKNEIKSYMLLIQSSYSDTLNYFLWKSDGVQKAIKESFSSDYPWPLNIILYWNEYYFKRKYLQSNNLWDLKKDKVMHRFSEVNECLNKKLKDNAYLMGNNMTEVDILLYSFIKVLTINSVFEELNASLGDLTHLRDYFAKMDQNMA
ncbi:metaxin-2 isoform X1, partial [Brachionus plicatilis]